MDSVDSLHLPVELWGEVFAAGLSPVAVAWRVSLASKQHRADWLEVVLCFLQELNLTCVPTVSANAILRRLTETYRQPKAVLLLCSSAVTPDEAAQGKANKSAGLNLGFITSLLDRTASNLVSLALPVDCLGALATNLPHLKHFSVDWHNSTGQGDVLRALPKSLTSLSLYRLPKVFNLDDVIACHTQLKSLTVVGGTNIHSDESPRLSPISWPRMVNLTSLNLAHVSINSTTDIAVLTALTDLTLVSHASNGFYFIGGLRDISAMTQLRRLHYNATSLWGYPVEVSVLGTLTNLVELDITGFFDSHIDHFQQLLSSLPQLQTISVYRGTAMTDSWLQDCPFKDKFRFPTPVTGYTYAYDEHRGTTTDPHETLESEADGI